MRSLTFAEERANALDCARIGREILSAEGPDTAEADARENIARNLVDLRGYDPEKAERLAAHAVSLFVAIARDPQPVAAWKGVMHRLASNARGRT